VVALRIYRFFDFTISSGINNYYPVLILDCSRSESRFLSLL
jgi:hypothetical protein